MSLEYIIENYPDLFERINHDFPECSDIEIKDICERCIIIEEEADLIY